MSVCPLVEVIGRAVPILSVHFQSDANISALNINQYPSQSVISTV